MSELIKNLKYENLIHFFSCDTITHYMTQFMFIAFFWCTLWSITGSDALPPNGSHFHMLLLFMASYLTGELMSVFNLPPLLGMLVIGCLLGNLFEFNLSKHLVSSTRSTALVIILLRAGLELDPKKIIKLSAVCFRLSFGPCIAETLTVAISAHLLIGLSFEWSLLLGFVLAAVSPAIVVAGLLPLKEQGYGVDKGIPTILIAAAGCDDILAISGVVFCCQLVFDTGSPLVWLFFKPPVEALIGVMSGIMIGLTLWYIPLANNSKVAEKQRFLILFFSGMTSKFASHKLDLESVGPLNCLVSSFISAINWREFHLHRPIRKNLKILWTIFQPFLFGLIGIEVKLRTFSSNVGLGLICLLIGVTIRTITAMLVVFGADLNFKEKLFIGLAWLPKATVQAALGPLALDMARERNDPNKASNIENAQLVLTIAVLSILLTAPLGAIAIALAGPKLLEKTINEISSKPKHKKLSTTSEETE